MIWRSAVAAAVLLFANAARADETSDRAEALYTQGKEAAAAGDYAKACPLFEQSQALESAIGTQFNLADCYEHIGRGASALALFHEVERTAAATGKHERQKAAEERIAKLEDSVVRVRVTVKAPVNGERVFLDGREPEAPMPERGIPLDPGAHVVRAEAPSFEPWEQKLAFTATTTVAIPALTPIRVAVALPPPPPPKSPAMRYAGWGLVAAGAVGIGVGTIFGLDALGKKNDAGCNGADCSRAASGSGDKLRDAQSAATVSTIGFIAGGVLAAGGVVLLYFGSRTRVGATPSPSGMTIAVSGAL